ncbi:hypothetical protein EV714DRAFT_217590 [Schizophyllum commune]
MRVGPSILLQHLPSGLTTFAVGHPDYGCFIAREKTLTNFDYDEQVMNVIPSGQRGDVRRAHEPITATILMIYETNLADFPWCGYLIDMKNLTISVDYTRYKDKGESVLYTS